MALALAATTDQPDCPAVLLMTTSVLVARLELVAMALVAMTAEQDEKKCVCLLPALTDPLLNQFLVSAAMTYTKVVMSCC